jgi:PadR family transcriptional regulator, regulatory protein AphA
MDGSNFTVQPRLLQEDLRLTPTSYIVLGLLSWREPATPYELKQLVSISVGNFWTLHHAQLYSEPARLAAAGYVTEEREDGGRRRKRYALTGRGRKALKDWLKTPPGKLLYEFRDPAMLQLFFGAEPKALATRQAEAHKAKLAEFEELHASAGKEMSEGQRLTLEAGIGHEREFQRFWERVARDGRR